MGALFNVHNTLGPSLLEKYYQRALVQEFLQSGLDCKREVAVNLEYNGKNIGRYFIDFIIEDLVILETKAHQQYSPKFFQQTLAYLQQVDLPLGIIANFRGDNVRYKRVVNPKFELSDLSSIDIRYKI